MPDSPDYDKYKLQSVRFSLQDMGELAARLGSLSTYDRRGEVLFADDFGNGTGMYNKTGSGGTGDFTLSVSAPLFSGFCGKLQTNASASAYESFYRNFSSTEVRKFGFETSLSMTDDKSEVGIRIDELNNTTQTRYWIKINNDTNTITYIGNDGNFHTLDTITWFNSPSGTYRFVKLVVDYETNSYVRLQIDGFEYDLSGIEAYSFAISEQYGYNVAVLLTTTDSTATDMYIGHVIITGNEP